MSLQPSPVRTVTELPSGINFLPLTTIYTPPSECATRWVWIEDSFYSGDPYIELFGHGVSSKYWRDCVAYGLGGIPTYSPGMCPSGQTFEVIFKEPLLSDSSLAHKQGGWAATCCPSGMSTYGRACGKLISTPFTAFAPVPTTWRSKSATLSISLWDVDTLVDTIVDADGTAYATNSVTTRSTVVASSGTAFANAVLVLWHSSDLSLFPTAYAQSLASIMGVPFESSSTGSSSAVPGPTLTPSLTTMPKSTTPPSPDDGGLSGSVKAGIGVGASLAAALLGGVVLFLVLRRRKQHQQPDIPEMSGESSGFKKYLGGRWRAEAEGKSEPSELGGRIVHVVPGSPAELDGTPW